jgi:tungstate transport system ATP-binding protein
MTMRAPTSDLPIVLEDLSVKAGAVTILDRVSLTIHAGVPTILIGPNGSGKTTLLRVLMGLQPPSAGRITWGGRDDAPPEKRALVFQRPIMLRRSAGANLRYALKVAGMPRGTHEQRVTELLQLVGLENFASRPARRLSGGEQQRLALARALARDPAVLMLDEPAASLDPAATKAVEDTIRTISSRGVKVVMSTHNLGQARRLGGDIVFMHRGHIIESGPAATLLDNPNTPEAKAFVSGELLI